VDVYTVDALEDQGIVVDKTLFCQQNYQSILSYVTYISSEALDKIHEYTGSCFEKVFSSSVQYSYYRSICNICLAAQGDNYTISEFNTAFHPININDFKKIKFYKKLEFMQVQIVLVIIQAIVLLQGIYGQSSGLCI